LHEYVLTYKRTPTSANLNYYNISLIQLRIGVCFPIAVHLGFDMPAWINQVLLNPYQHVEAADLCDKSL